MASSFVARANSGTNDATEAYVEEIGGDLSPSDQGTVSGIGAFTDSTVQGAQSGGTFGPVGSLIGGIAGALIGVVDAIVTSQSATAQAEALIEDAAIRAEFDANLRDLMDFRDEIDKNLAAMLSPLEQQFRTRSKLAGAAARRQGLRGAQAIAAQMEAEDQYRRTIGAALPGLLQQAGAISREQSLLKIKQLEAEFGIRLDAQAARVSQEEAVARSKSQALSGITSTIGRIGGVVGNIIDDNPQQQQSQAGGSVEDGTVLAADENAGDAGLNDGFGLGDFSTEGVT